MTDTAFHLQHQVLQFMSAHGAPTAKQIAEHFGRDLDWAQQTIRNLQRRQYIATQPVTYIVNERGSKAMVRPMKTTPVKRARAKAERKKAATLREISRDTFKPEGHDYDGIVATAKRTQANSVFSLGSA